MYYSSQPENYLQLRPFAWSCRFDRNHIKKLDKLSLYLQDRLHHYQRLSNCFSLYHQKKKRTQIEHKHYTLTAFTVQLASVRSVVVCWPRTLFRSVGRSAQGPPARLRLKKTDVAGIGSEKAFYVMATYFRGNRISKGSDLYIS